MRKHSNSIKPVFLLLLSFATSGSFVFAGNSNENEVVDAIKVLDTLYHAELRAEGIYSRSGNISSLNMDFSFPLSELKFTKSYERCALTKTVIEGDPWYHAYFFDGRQVFAKDSKTSVYNHLRIKDMDSNAFYDRQKFVLYALGRGAVSQIDDLIEFRVNEDTIPETIYIKGKGISLLISDRRDAPRDDGIWEVEVLPNTGYMLRKAKFYYEGLEEFDYILETSGVINKNDCFYPESATILSWYSSGEHVEHKYQFTDVQFEFDNKLYDEVKSLTDRSMEQKDTFIMDDSGGKSEVRVVGANMRQDYEISPASPKRWGIIIVVNLLLIALLVFSIYRNHKIKQQSL